MAQVIISADGLKPIVGTIIKAARQGLFHPNTSTSQMQHSVSGMTLDCGSFAGPTYSGRCLFDVRRDRGEHVDLTQLNVSAADALAARLAEYQTTVYSPQRGSPGAGTCHTAQQR